MRKISNMAILLDGKALALEKREFIKQETIYLVRKHKIIPHLVVILIGEDPASQSYVKGKEKACLNAGIKSTIIRKTENVTEVELISIIDQLNDDKTVHGILLQLPIPQKLDMNKIINRISPSKDVDGFTLTNVAYLANGNPKLVPCTPLGIMKLLEKYQVQIEGKHCVIIGRSQIVGKPMASLLLKANGTVTICHSKTVELAKIAKQADILVVAIGKSKMVDDSFVKKGAVVIDVGISKINGSISGDVDFDKACKIASYITPVPGGVGPMTIACLLENTLSCYKMIMGE